MTQNYDGNGNLLFDGQSAYTYDAINRMTGAQTADHTATYVFDSFDRRISKTVDSNTAAYLFDGDHIVAEYESGALARKFVYGPGIDEPLMMIVGENRYFYHANEKGSILALSNVSGALAETYLYSPYGELGFEGALGNPYLYTGPPLRSRNRPLLLPRPDVFGRPATLPPARSDWIRRRDEYVRLRGE